jgi:hypothetical protein
MLFGITTEWRSASDRNRVHLRPDSPLGGKVVATYRPDTDWTYDKNGVRIGTGNRLAGMVGDEE